MAISSFSAIETEFIYCLHRVVWCNLATIDTRNRPRLRILHPIREGSISWIGTRPQTLKAKYLAHNPYVSLACTADKADPIYIDCKAEWIDDTQQKLRIWDTFKNALSSLGYDAATIYKGADYPAFGLLKLTPWRIELAKLPAESESGTQKNHHKIGKKTVKISHTKKAQITHNHPKKCVAKSERNPPDSLARGCCKQPMVIRKKCVAKSERNPPDSLV
ncbi:MAG TPA: pyridoxamine 5'-phosphate oxidase family protein [Ktedonobacteraceae bacterium]